MAPSHSKLKEKPVSTKDKATDARTARKSHTTSKANVQAEEISSTEESQPAKKRPRRHQTTVEEIIDEDAAPRAKSTANGKRKATVTSDQEDEGPGDDDDDDDVDEDEDAETELGMWSIYLKSCSAVNFPLAARLRTRWTSPVYAFYDAGVRIETHKGRRSHVFSCASPTCSHTLRRYVDKRDRSTGNMRKHALSCWGEEAVARAMEMADDVEARRVVVESLITTGRISTYFGRNKKGNVTYSHMQHTKEETR